MERQKSISYAASSLIVAFLISSCVCSGSLGASSPNKARETDAIARQLLDKFADEDKKRVLVMDFQPSFGEPSSFGPWLAEQLMSSLESQGQALELVDRSRLGPELQALHLSPKDEWTVKNAVALGRSLGASTVVLSSYGYAKDGVGVTLAAFRVSEFEARPPTRFVVGIVFGKMPITQELSARLGESLDALEPKDGVYKSGFGGVSIPVCIKCPPPTPRIPDIDLRGLLRAYPRGAAISLQFIVTAGGHTRNIKVVQPIGFGFDEQLTKAAADWEFKPAVDADGKPVSVLFPFQFMLNFK